MLSATINSDRTQRRLNNADLQLDLIEKLTGKTSGNIYDVGCAGGFFIKQARARGWWCEGNEISTKAIEWSKKTFGIDIDYGFLEELDLKETFYDCIVLWNSIEHLIDLNKTLCCLKKMMKPQGIVMIETPNKSELQIETLFEGPHNFEFSHKNLSLLMEKKGLQLIYLFAGEREGFPYMDLAFKNANSK